MIPVVIAVVAQILLYSCFFASSSFVGGSTAVEKERDFDEKNRETKRLESSIEEKDLFST